MERHPGSETGQWQGQLNEKELRKLLDVGRTLVAELDVEAVLRHVLETARELTGARYAALGILDERKEELERFVFMGIDEETRRLIGPLPRGGGVLGELIRNPQPLRLPDVTQHPRSYGFPPGHPPMTTFLGVPISIRGEAWGNLYLTDKAEGAEFDDRDQESAIVLAEWASIAIGNARLYEDVARRRAELERAVRGLEATATMARAVGFETDLERVLELVVKRGRALLDADSLLVILEEGDKLRVAAAAGEIGAECVGVTLPLEGTLVGSVVTNGTSERVSILADRMGHGLDAVATGARSALVAPLGFRDRARGALLALDNARGMRGFEPDEEYLLTSFGASAAIAIATAQSVETERLKHSIRASESERSRWARELHDETLQELGALKVMLESAHGTGQPEKIQDAVERSLEQLGYSITGLQSLITELRPASLDELGVKPGLDALVRRASTRFGLKVDAHFDLAYDRGRAPSRLVGEIESTIYRLVQEAINNVVKHAQAETLQVEVVEADGSVVLTVRDDGSGFETGRPGAGFGLVGMRERVELVDGRFVIDSTPGRGTVVRAEIPAVHEPVAGGVSESAAPESAQG
jgi:two-component system, NarL family, sensor histidine kinase DevS